MAGDLRVHRRPQLTRPVLIAAFRGWNDGAQAASLAAGYLAKTWEAERFAEANPASAQVRDRVTSGAARNANVDEDEDQLAAYNDYLARINRTAGRESGPAAG